MPNQFQWFIRAYTSHESLRWHALASAGYMLLALLVFAPVLPVFGQAIPGGPVARIDGWQNVWNLWWANRALSRFENPFFTTYLYYPTGVDLSLQTLNISNGILVAPVTWLAGPVAAYNTALLLAFILAGLGGYALALRITRHHPAAFVGGLIFTFSPFHMTKAWDGQLELIALHWLAFYALFLLRAAEDGRRRDVLLAGILLALVGYTSWYYLLFAAIYSALFAVLWAATAPTGTRLGLLARLLAAATVAGVLLAPVLVPAIRSANESTVNPELIAIHSANLLDFLLPSALHPVWGAAVETFGARLHPVVAGWNAAPGYIALALALLALLVARQTAWRWWILTLTALILALGPVLKIGTATFDLPMPYGLLAHLPGVGLARRPNHFVVIATLLLAPLAALGVRWLLEHVRPVRRSLALAALIGLLACEYAPPAWQLWYAEVHPYYAKINGTTGAVLDLPPRDESSAPLQAQMIHERPILGGFVSRTPLYPFVQQVPGVRELWARRPYITRLPANDPGDALVALNTYDIRTIVVHWSDMNARDRAGLQEAIILALPDLPVQYADESISVYRVPDVPLRPFAFSGSGWYNEERDGARAWRWMADSGEIVVVNPTEHPVSVRVRLVAQSYLQPRRTDIWISGQYLGGWDVGIGATVLNLQLLVPPGESRLLLRAPAAQEPGEPRRWLSLALIDAHVR